MLPAYLYEPGPGLRVEATNDRTGVTALPLMVDADLAVRIAALALAGVR